MDFVLNFIHHRMHQTIGELNSVSYSYYFHRMHPSLRRQRSHFSFMRSRSLQPYYCPLLLPPFLGQNHLPCPYCPTFPFHSYHHSCRPYLYRKLPCSDSCFTLCWIHPLAVDHPFPFRPFLPSVPCHPFHRMLVKAIAAFETWMDSAQILWAIRRQAVMVIVITHLWHSDLQRMGRWHCFRCFGLRRLRGRHPFHLQHSENLGHCY